MLYVLVYTPLKPLTTLNTAVGAIPGALPPVIGWAAATGRLGIEAWALFLIVFLWQFPHFLAIAWIYREDYRAGGMQDAAGGRPARADDGLPGGLLCPGPGPRRAVARRRSAWPGRSTSSAPGPGTDLPGRGRPVLADVPRRAARRLLRTSFVYLPAILLLLLLNPLPA